VAPEDTAVDAVETTAGHGAAGGAAHMGSGRRWLNRASGGLVGQALGSGDGRRREAAGGGSQGRDGSEDEDCGVTSSVTRFLPPLIF
jgi:hypothetical protein